MPVSFIKENLDRVRGHLVTMPLNFLEKEDLLSLDGSVSLFKVLLCLRVFCPNHSCSLGKSYYFTVRPLWQWVHLDIVLLIRFSSIYL